MVHRNHRARTLGQWEERVAGEWVWKSRGIEAFDPAEGSWLFTGSKPIYSWTFNRWAFVSATPALCLLKRDEVLVTPFQGSAQHNLKVAYNSDAACNKFDHIKITYDKVYHFTKDDTSVIPWADKTDSRSISSHDWNSYLRESEATRDWIQHEDPLEISKRFKTGAAAMEPSGFEVRLNGKPTELLTFDESELVFYVNYADAIKEGIEARMEFSPKNMKLERDIKVQVTVLNQIDGVASVRFSNMDRPHFKTIRVALETQQAEVFVFLKAARGW